MGKRSDFARRRNDLYRTFDPRAVAALLPHLGPFVWFYEPCAGDGVLVDQLEAVGRLRWIEGTTMDGKDDCAWYLFDQPVAGHIAEFHLRERSK